MSKNRHIRAIIVVLYICITIFIDCTGYATGTLTLPSKLKTIEEEAFYGDKSIGSVVLPNTIKKIGDRAFANSSLTEITLPSSITSISDSAFDGCKKVIAYTIENSTAYNYVEAHSNMINRRLLSDTEKKNAALYTYSTIDANACSLTGYVGTASKLTIPAYSIEGIKVTKIADKAFEGNTVISSVTIPETVESIDEYAFHNCSSLKSVDMKDGVTSIGRRVFENCTSLVDIHLSNKINHMHEYVFLGCSKLKTLTYPLGMVTKPSDRAWTQGWGYDHASALSKSSVETLIIPDGATAIMKDAFFDATSLKKVYIPASVTSFDQDPGNSGVTHTAFQNITKIITIYGVKGSTSETYAKAKGIAFVDQSATPTVSPTPTIPPTLKPSTVTPKPATATPSPVVYKIKYNANGGSGAPSSQTKTKDVTLTLSSTKPTRSGYTFLGWSTSSIATTATYAAGGTYTKNANATLYAVWEKIPVYTISYNANGGSGAPSSQTKTKDVALTLSSTKPTRSGYTFLGWSTSSSATSATYAAGDTYTKNANATLYAVWEKVPVYTISYNANGGSGAPSSQTKTKDVTLTLSSTKPTRSGYTFLGWSINSSATSATYDAGGSYTTNADATLYAVWEKVPVYTISYNANGGSGAPSSQTKTKDVALTLSSTKPTRSGYTFLGWAASSSATIVSYYPGDTYYTNKNITLYAVWELDHTTFIVKHGSEVIIADGYVEGYFACGEGAGKGATATFTITADDPWTVRATDTSWMTVSTQDGTKAVITIGDVQDGESYSSTLIFTCNGERYDLYVTLDKPGSTPKPATATPKPATATPNPVIDEPEFSASFYNTSKTIVLGERWLVEGSISVTGGSGYLGKVTINAEGVANSSMTQDFTAHSFSSVEFKYWYAIDTTEAPWNIPGTYNIRVWAKDTNGTGGDKKLATMSIMIVEQSVEDRLTAELTASMVRAKQLSGDTSYNGYCGRCTGYQLYAVGIFNYYVGFNGNDAYNTLKQKNASNGASKTLYPGAYKGGAYTITQILNELNAANTDGHQQYTVFGFHTGSSSNAGQTYGHVLLVHSVYNGKVYWCESFGAETRVATIASFANTYAQSGNVYQFDGAIAFGK